MTVTRQDFIDAVTAYWGAKEIQLGNSRIAQAVGAGTAGSVRGGKHFDAIGALVVKFFIDAGYPPESIHLGRRSGLPGFYRPLKNWDVVVTHGGTLVAGFEFKALGGPSYGNNLNNRVEEALGNSVDLRRAALENLYPGEKPWLGYFFIMQDEIGSRRPVRISNGALPAAPVWAGKSYQERGGIFCTRLIAEQLYDTVCYITSASDKPSEPEEPVEQLNWRHFAAAVNARISYLADLGIP